MGQPNEGDTSLLLRESQPRELKHLSTWRKRNQLRDSPSSGERTGKSPNRRGSNPAGVVGPSRRHIERVAERAWNGGPERVRVPYAKPK